MPALQILIISKVQIHQFHFAFQMDLKKECEADTSCYHAQQKEKNLQNNPRRQVTSHSDIQTKVKSFPQKFSGQGYFGLKHPKQEAQNPFFTKPEQQDHPNKFQQENVCNFTYSQASFNLEEEPMRKKISPYTHKKPINPNRKTRTTITQDKIAMLNRIFKVYDFFKQRNQDISGNLGKKTKFEHPQDQKLTDEDFLLKTFDLKEAARYLGLSYSAVVHKYQEYKSKNKVSCGVRVLSKYQKRKYQKTYKLQELILEILKEKPFYTAMQISKYILVKCDLFFSRAKINRTLINLGFSLGMRSAKLARHTNKADTIDVRFKYAAYYESLCQQQVQFIYLDQNTFLANNFVNQKFSKSPEIILKTGQKEFEKIYVSLIVALTHQKVLYWDVKKGFYSSQDFQKSLSFLLEKYKGMSSLAQVRPPVLVTDLNYIHVKYFQSLKDQTKKLANQLLVSKCRKLYLPPYSPQLNPALRLFEQIQKRLCYRNEIRDIDELVQATKNQVQRISEKSTQIYFSQLEEWVSKCLNKSKF